MTNEKKFKHLVFILLIFGIILAYVGFIDGGNISRENARSIKGSLKDYRFDNLGRQRYDYTIYLNERPEPFQVTATLVDQFDRNGFEKSMQRNDTIELKYIVVSRLVFPDRNVLLSVKGKNDSFLSFEDSFKRTQSDSNFWKIIAVAVLAAGITILVVQRVREKVAITSF